MTATHPSFSPAVRAFVRHSARLALFIIVFQLVAIDHWHGSIADVQGVEDSQLHVMHCHGASSGCADAGGTFGALPSASLTPASPLAFSQEPVETAPTPGIAFIPVPGRPPSFTF
jgi:hypothetical protein